jgi:hypothetical protein
MRIRFSFLPVAACLLGMAMPVWASTLSTKVQFNHATKLVNVNLKPGQYRLLANESTGQVKVERNYKVVARVEGKWVKLGRKSQYSEVLSTNHRVQEIRFAGKKKAVKFSA